MGKEAINLRKILENDFYIIPRYQRNYAWGKKEISQLIKDIDEFFDDKTEKSYYLGTLVCFKRDDKESRTCYELIDGQQRHTTITLINLVLKNWENPMVENVVHTPNLKFDSRKKPQNYIEKLYQNTNKEEFDNQIDELNISGTDKFKEAIEFIREDLRNLKNTDVSKFADNFYNRVFLFRVEVPEDTDLNHYFEIMNNRGEQLEKHEIVKALLMGKLENKEEQEKFASIWDACSDMSDYVYFNFNADTREKLFDCKRGTLKSVNFSEISINTKGESDTKQTLASIITEHRLPDDFPEEEKYTKDKYKSIIDFPNFLLQVLKLKNAGVSLDDKKLVEQFGEIQPKSEEIIYDLLKYRTLFDKYIIKQDLADANETKQNWGIRKLNVNNNEYYPIKTFEQGDEELVKLQVMLYYSYSTNTYNDWLFRILRDIHFEENVNDYTKRVFDIAKERFNKNKDKLSYPEINIFNLYYIDFLLWKLYKDEIQGLENFFAANENADNIDMLKYKIFKKRNLFNDFKFRQISSREHLLSQEHAKRDKIDKTIYNSIGNLCLISISQNSKGNKESPDEKKKLFLDDNYSLKRIIMFESFDENGKWRPEQIQKHEKDILLLIEYYK